MPPNPKCIVCSSKPEVIIKIDTNRVTVKQFRDDVLIKALNMVEPDVTVDSKGVILISSEEGETDCNDEKTLAELDVVDGCILKADDFFQNYELRIVILHKEPEREGALFEIIADPDTLKAEAAPEDEAKPVKSDDKNGAPDAKKPRIEDAAVVIVADAGVAAGPSAAASGSNGNQRTAPVAIDDDDDICIIEDDDVVEVVNEEVIDSRKRKTEEILGEPSSKRTKVVPSEVDRDEDIILIEDE